MAGTTATRLGRWWRAMLSVEAIGACGYQFGCSGPVIQWAMLENRGLPEVWRRSMTEALAVIDFLDVRIAQVDAELGPIARADPRVRLLVLQRHRLPSAGAEGRAIAITDS